jgi:hypothetical protein
MLLFVVPPAPLKNNEFVDPLTGTLLPTQLVPVFQLEPVFFHVYTVASADRESSTAVVTRASKAAGQMFVQRARWRFMMSSLFASERIREKVSVRAVQSAPESYG